MEILAGKDYDSLKDAVLHLVESSKPELFESLLQPEQLVGKPSSCLSVLQRTAAKVGVGEEFVRHKFISSLPANITPVPPPAQCLSRSWELWLTILLHFRNVTRCLMFKSMNFHQAQMPLIDTVLPSILVQACGLFTKASGPKFADPTYTMPKTQGHAGVGVSGLIKNPAKYGRIQGQIRLLRVATVTQTSRAHFKCGEQCALSLRRFYS